MRKLKVYLAISAVSYLYQSDICWLKKIKDSQELWQLFRRGHYEVYISDIVLNEICGCNQEKLDILFGYLKQVQYHLVHTDKDPGIQFIAPCPDNSQGDHRRYP